VSEPIKPPGSQPPGPQPPGPPADVTHLVRQRMEARARRDWPAADALKAQIESAGWKITDHGSRSSVSPAAPPTVEVGDEVRYGSAAAVASRLSEPPDAPWTVIVLASEAAERASRLLAGLRSYAPAGTQVVVVANDPSAAQEAALADGTPDRAPVAGRDVELVRTVTRLGHAAALNIAMQRAAGELVLLADGSARPAGDAFAPLAEALADPAVGTCGGFGLRAPEEGRLVPAALVRADAPAAEASDVVALEGAWLAFRRSDYAALGPLDEHFVTPAWLDVWWSLRLRAGEEPETADANEAEPANEDDDLAVPDTTIDELPAPRRAVSLTLPLEREAVPWPPDRSRLNRRNMYRVLDRFGWRGDL